ncbi:hypothetical protein SLS60_006347 [Paraconiothyrium brasiliense]|uniref:Uncharacterized protein n=1 Tax=Paraconiothyrium brasiliense TaxID=300254 RepID=A0ABR3RAF8_9PLEO
MSDLEEYDLSDEFAEMYEATAQIAEEKDATTSGEHSEADDGDVLTPPEEIWDEGIAEDIGYDEEYSDNGDYRYTPGDSPTLGNDGVTDTIPVPEHEQRDQEGVVQTEASASSANPPESSPNDPRPGPRLSALLNNLYIMASTGVFAQGRRGSTPASENDERAEEGPPSDDATEDETSRLTPDSSSPARRHSIPYIPSVVDLIAESRAIAREEWNRVYRNDPEYFPNPYDSVDDWDYPYEWH